MAPRELRTAASVAGTTAAVKGPSNPGRESYRIADETKAKAPFPAKERNALARAYRTLGPSFNICLKRKTDWVTTDGRYASEMEPAIVCVQEVSGLRPAAASGSRLMRRPEAAKMAFVSAGVAGGVEGSPAPPGGSVEAMIWVSIRGAVPSLSIS